MKRKRKKIDAGKAFLLMLFVGSIIMIIVKIVGVELQSRPTKIKLDSKIEWLETRDPATYKDLKSKLATYVAEEYELKKTVTNVVFKVYATDIFSEFVVDIWYKCEGTWYIVTIRESKLKDAEIVVHLRDVIRS